MKLEDFIATAYRDHPETIDASDLARVSPNPWIWRTGSGKDAPRCFGDEAMRRLVGAGDRFVPYD